MTLTGRMTENEKYIAFTRALDELWVCPTRIRLLESSIKSTEKTQSKTIGEKKGETKSNNKESKVKEKNKTGPDKKSSG